MLSGGSLSTLVGFTVLRDDWLPWATQAEAVSSMVAQRTHGKAASFDAHASIASIPSLVPRNRSVLGASMIEACITGGPLVLAMISLAKLSTPAKVKREPPTAIKFP